MARSLHIISRDRITRNESIGDKTRWHCAIVEDISEGQYSRTEPFSGKTSEFFFFVRPSKSTARLRTLNPPAPALECNGVSASDILDVKSPLRAMS